MTSSLLVRPIPVRNELASMRIKIVRSASFTDKVPK
jgi:hypothetical protein